MAKSKSLGQNNADGGSVMAALLASSEAKIPSLKRGQEVVGKVVLASPGEILLDIGAKSEGVVSGRELSAARDLVSKIGVGDTISATVLYPENDAGQVVLTLRKLSGEKRWQELDDKKDTGDLIQVVAQEANRGGVICDFLGIRGFLPASQLAQTPSKLESLIGKNLTVAVIEVDRPTNRLIFSQKRPGKKDLSALLALLARVKIGERYQGVVSAILPFGVFVEIEVKSTTSSKGTTSTTGIKKTRDTRDTLEARDTFKLEGLVHISEISWEKVDDPGKMFKVGDSVDVMVVAKDSSIGRLNLSIKQLTPDPFAEASKKYSREMKVKGTVSRVTPYGVFVELDKETEGITVEGLIHISKIGPNVEYKEGQKVECEIESVDAAARRIALSPVVTEKPVLYR